jgi:hypothetical protein
VHTPPFEKVPVCSLSNGWRVNATVPLGVIAVPAALLSVIVAVHVAGCPNGTYTGEHIRTVLAERKLTRTGSLPFEGACEPSPG